MKVFTPEEIKKLPEPRGFLLADIFDNLVFDDFNMNYERAAEPFCKDGLFHTKYIIDRFDHTLCMDIDPECVKQCEANYMAEVNDGQVTVKEYDAVKFLTDVANHGWLDCLVLDAPLMMWGEKQAEHFGIFHSALDLLSEDSILILNTVSSPYNYDEPNNAEWRRMRELFYGKKYTAHLDIPWLHKFYIAQLEQHFNVVKTQWASRFSLEFGDHMGFEYHGFRLTRL